MAKKTGQQNDKLEKISDESAPDFIRVPIGNTIGKFFNVPKILRRLLKERADLETRSQDTSDG